MNCDLAELLGMHAGDGTIYRTKYGLVWELRGGLDEKEFYDSYVIPLLRRVYNFPFIAKKRSGGKNGCYGTRCCKKEFIQLLLNKGFPVGKKTKTVKIPKKILSGKKEWKTSFLRGLLATDGTAYLAKINRSEIPNYPIIELNSVSKKLIEQVKDLLLELNVKSYTWTYKHKQRGDVSHHLRCSGIEKCQNISKIIGLANYKHRRKMIILDAKQ